ncbi:hypothetical protein Asp14428_51520 [Actinoplanes sp. NBRC 14428]|uniref:Uncharacterized protein n=1 Tax=Pseudosporangium ferrugineum TaxID=439699 RepID=A0A2T0S6F9_9ACTN|nr:DUF6023 family protein [Pseudosporangium ferrugineum]PRY28863.1 hypothetical protein CLV70_107168 [Pseudosporangium ferrugineum]BCJ53677.1 hypothetical protein Asp14428_51520 [Actinoplanes sp. NBRC 14428]
MTRDRAQGITLYALTAVLALAGAAWYVRAAPPPAVDPRIAAGRRTVELLLPEVPTQAQAETMVLSTGDRTQRSGSVRSGSYELALACLGTGQIRVRLSTTPEDSGRAVPCAPERPEKVALSVALASSFFLVVSAETEGTSVFRYRLSRVRSY